MKAQLLNDLYVLLNYSESIKFKAKEIGEIFERLDPELFDLEREGFSGLVKNAIQAEAIREIKKHEGWGAILAATGIGKSKIIVDYVAELIKENKEAKVLVVVPTEKLRDESWKEEFVKWGYSNNYENIEMTCYASLHTYKDQIFDLVVLDEGHNITERNSLFFGAESANIIRRCIFLSGTKPRSRFKIDILKSIGINPIYEITIDEAVMLRLVAPYEITVVRFELDNVDKYIVAGSKNNPFMVTEKGQYTYLSSRLMERPTKMGFLMRMRFIRNFRSKERYASWILENIIPKDLRTLIFCGSKVQAVELCDRRFFSKPAYKKTDSPKKREEVGKLLEIYDGDDSYRDFVEERTNRLSCVEALNEGLNIPNMDVCFIVQLDSNPLNTLQRIGRLVRFRAGHIGKIIILCAKGTVDEDWTNKAIKGLNRAKIRWVEMSKLQSREEVIELDN